MLHEFLLKNENEILNLTEKKTLPLAGLRPSSDQLKKGLPLFYHQLITILQSEALNSNFVPVIGGQDEKLFSTISELPNQALVTTTARLHGSELLRLGYTLSHVVNAYGAMCQAITELATIKKINIASNEFHFLNLTLDIAIAAAVTEFESNQKFKETNREVEHLGFLAHELRNALYTIKLSLQLIKDGTVGFNGSTGQVLDKGLSRIEELIERSLAEVRLRVDPKVHMEKVSLIQIINQILVTAEIEAQQKNISFEIQVDANLIAEVDQQLIYSALSNLIQNALKYTLPGSKIRVRGISKGDNIEIEIEDECGGLKDDAIDLFQPFVQQNENRKGLGLGLTIAKRAVALQHGTITVHNLPTKGCIFKISIPNPK